MKLLTASLIVAALAVVTTVALLLTPAVACGGWLLDRAKGWWRAHVVGDNDPAELEDLVARQDAKILALREDVARLSVTTATCGRPTTWPCVRSR